MAFPSRKAAIVGVYTTPHARHLTRSPVSLQLEAMRGAVADAGLSVHDIDGLIPLDPAPYGNVPSVHMFWAEQLGERPITFMEVGIASGALAKAATAVSAGLCEGAVLFWANRGCALSRRGQSQRGQL